MRIRTVKPEFWTHPIMTKLDMGARLLAIAILNYADDHGYFYADTDMVRGAVMFREDSSNVRRWLDDLSRTGFIEVQEHPTHGPIGRVVKFVKHQKVDRPKDSIVAALWDSTNVRRLIDDQSSLEQGTGNREQGNREQGIEGTRDGAEIIPIDAKKTQEPTAYQKIEPATRDALDILTKWLIAANQTKSRHWRPNPAMLAAWPVEFHDLMVSRPMTAPELSAVLEWSQASNFWGPVIQSPADLAKNLDKIAAQMQRDKGGSVMGSRKPGQGHVDKFPDTATVM